MKKIVITALFVFTTFGQTVIPRIDFPAVPLPVAVAAFGEFNQLGDPRFTMGVSAIYPVVGSLGIYATTTADILPKRSVDPATKRSFYALSTSMRQGFHKDVLDTGRATILVGGDVGPAFSQALPTGIGVNFSSSFVATVIYQLTPAFSFIAPLRVIYMPGMGWNPVVEAGIMVNLKSLPPKK